MLKEEQEILITQQVELTMKDEEEEGNEDELESMINHMKEMKCSEFDSTKKDCINNEETTFFTKDPKASVTFYECPKSCCAKVGYMCGACAKNCHSHFEKDNMAFKEVFKNKIRCGCAKMDHFVDEKVDKQVESRDSLQNRCQQFNEFLNKLNIRIWARPVKKQKLVQSPNVIPHEEYKGGEQLEEVAEVDEEVNTRRDLCLYCYEKCTEVEKTIENEKVKSSKRIKTSEKDLYEIVSESEETKFENFVCSCKSSANHDLTFMKKEVIKAIASNDNNSLYFQKFDKLCLMGKILTGDYYFTDHKFDETNQKIKKAKELEDNFFDNSYLQVLELVEAFTNLNKNVVYNITSDPKYKFKSLDIDFMKNLTDIILKKKPTECLEISTIILPKLLYFYRYFHIYPKLQIKNLKLIHKHRENISPIHRYFLKEKIDNFYFNLCDKSKMSSNNTNNNEKAVDPKKEYKEKFDSFFDNVFQIIKMLLKDGIGTGNFAELIRQFFQFVELMLCYQMEIEQFSRIVVKILGILKFNKTNPTVFGNEECKDEGNIEIDSAREGVRLVYPGKSNTNDDKKNDNTRILMKLNRDIRKLMPLLVICLNDIQFEKEVFPKNNSYDRKKQGGFIFENSEIQRNILQIFFYADKNNFNGLYIYQTMLEKNDSYLDNIRYMLNAKDNFFNEDFEKVYMGEFDERNFFNKHGYERSADNIPDPRMSNYEELKKKYFLGEFKNTQEFLEKDLKGHVERYLKQEIKSCLNLTSKDEKFMKQLYLVKKGFLEIALDVFKLLTGNDYYTKDDAISVVTHNMVSMCLKHILGALTEGNAFLSTIFFTPKMINLFFRAENKRYIMEVVKFYLTLLDSIAESGVKINVKFILEKVTHKTKDNHARFNFSKKSTKDNIHYGKISSTKDVNGGGSNGNFAYDIVTMDDIRQELCSFEEETKTGVSSVNLINLRVTTTNPIVKTTSSSASNNEKLALLFNLYYKLLCVSTENTEVYINDLMVSVARNIITDSEIKKTMKEYEEKVGKGKVDPHLEGLTLKIFEILNKISTNYFYLINNYIDSELLENLLRHFDKLNPGSRLIINKLYLRNKMKLPFQVNHDFMRTFYQLLENGKNTLVIGEKGLPIELDDFDKINNKLDDGNYMTNNTNRGGLPRSNTLMGNNTSRGNRLKQKGTIYSVNAVSKDFDNGYEYSPESIDPTLYKDFELIKNILENFKLNMIKKFEKDYFKNNPNSLLEFFEEVVLKTGLYTLYKIIYFNAKIDNNHKYYIYSIVYLFLDNLLFVLRSILERPKADFESYTVIFKRHFKFTDPKRDDVRLLIERLYQEVETKIKDIELGKYDYFNHIDFLKLFNQFASSFQCFEKQNKQKYFKHTSEYNKHFSAFYKKVSQSYSKYKDKKGDNETNLLIKIIKNSSESTNNELFQDLKAKIVDDLIKKFTTYGSKMKHDRTNYLDQVIGSGIEEIFPIVKKIVSVDPGLYQKYINKHHQVNKDKRRNKDVTKDPQDLIRDMISEKIPYLMQFVLIEFAKNNIVSDIPYLSLFKEMLQFLEYISEKNELTNLIASTPIYLPPKVGENNLFGNDMKIGSSGSNNRIGLGNLHGNTGNNANTTPVICKFEDLLMTFLASIIENLRYYDGKKEMLVYLNPLLVEKKNQTKHFSFEKHSDGVKTKENFFNVFMEKIFHLISKLIRENETQMYKEPEDLENAGYIYPYGFNYVKWVSIELLKNSEKNNTFIRYLYHYFQFIDVISFEYEIDCDLKIKEVQNVMIQSFERLLQEFVPGYKQEKDSEENTNNNSGNVGSKVKGGNKIADSGNTGNKPNTNSDTKGKTKTSKSIDKDSAKDLLREIHRRKEIMQNYKFVILSKLYIFINNIAQLSTPAAQKYKKFLENIKRYKQEIVSPSTDTSNSNNNTTPSSTNNSNTLKREEKVKLCLGLIYSIFEELMRSVEIVYVKNAKKEKKDELEESDNEENEEVTPTPIQIFFITNHDGLMINRENTIKNFFAICRYSDGINKKLFFLINYYNYLNSQIEIIKDYRENKFKFRLLNLIPKDAPLEYVSSVFTVLTNISVMLSISYTDPLSALRSMENPFHWYTMVIAIIHLVFLAFCIGIISYQEWVCYSYFEKQNEKEKQKKEGDNNSELDYFKDFSNEKIYPLIWNFIFGFFALFNFPFLFSLQMFSLFLLFNTMKSAIQSVKLKYDKFLAAAFLIVILIIFYALITVIFFQDKFFNEDLNENVCESVFMCVLSLLSNGVKSGAGLGFSLTSRSDPAYWSEFIFEWIFYFTIILVMLNIVNGIIVDTFQSMRQQNEINDKKRDDLCYICSISRSKFESHGIFFKNHCLEEHNVYNYMQYIIKIRNSDESSLNSAELMVMNKLKDSRIDFFPIKLSKRLPEN